MINRRTLLKSGLFAALGAPALNVLAQTKPEILSFHTFLPEDSSLWVNGFKVWMDKIEKESDGRIKFEAFPSMQKGGAPKNLVDQVRRGTADIVWSLPGLTPGRFAMTEVFELPFFTYDGIGSSRAAWEFVSENAMVELRDFHLLAFHTHSRGVLHTREKAVKSAADLKGLKIPGSTRKVTQLLEISGAKPVSTPEANIAEHLSKGSIDGALLSWEMAGDLKTNDLTKHHTETPDSLPAIFNTTHFMLMNPKRYASMPADLKKVIDSNSGIEASAFLGQVLETQGQAARKAAVEKGADIHVMGQSEAEEWTKMTAKMEQEWINSMSITSGHDGPKILAAAKAAIQKYRPKA